MVWAVLRGKLWACPRTVVYFRVFIGYQVYEILVAGTGDIVLLTSFEVYRVRRTLHGGKAHRP